MSTTALRPLSLGELLDRTFFLYRSHFLLFVGIIAIPNIVLLAFQLAGLAFNPTGMRFSGIGALWTFLTYILIVPVTAAAQGATVLAVSKVHLGENTTVSESLAAVKGRILEISLITWGLGIGVVIGLVLGIIPGIILWLMWSLAIPIAVLEDTGLAETAARSRVLTKGSRGRIFLLVFLFLALFYILLVVLVAPLGVLLVFHIRSHGQHAGLPLWYLVGAPVASFFSTCLAGPLLMIGTALIYYDQRVRKEGFDLQLMMSNLDGTLPVAPSAPDTTLGIT